MIQVKSSTIHYINERALTFSENDLDDPQRVAVSLVSGTVVLVYVAGTIDYAANGNYERWTLKGYSTKFPEERIEAHNIYARLSRNDRTALIVFSVKNYNIDGSITTITGTDENGNDITETTDPSADYFYIKIGELTATDGTSYRELTYDSGLLGTDKGNAEKDSLSDMWELDKYSIPWLIHAKQWLYNFTVKGFIKLIGGFMFSKGQEGDEKIITDVKRSTDSDNEYLLDDKGEPLKDENGEFIPDPAYMAPSDEVLVTSLYVKKKIEDMDSSKFLRKDQDDRTPFNLSVGGVLSAETSILFQEKQISGFIRYYDSPRPEIVTDVDFYSALMTDQRIKEEMRNLDDRYLRKDKEDTAHKHITFEEGITVYGLAKMMRLEVSELATIVRAIVDVLGSAKFVDGFFGEGYQIWKSVKTEDWCMTIDRLTVRKIMTVYELLIQKIRSVGGMLVISAGNGKIKEVVREGLEYRISFEDTNMFVENDLIRCQVWTGEDVKGYWVEVVRVKDDCVYVRVEDFEGFVPEAGDEVVLMGNTKNKLRQNLLVLSATEDGRPRFDCIDGVDSKNFEGCLRTRVGCLDGISDDLFPPGLQPQGYGLYADNCYLRGVFVLSTGKDVETQFSVMEGQIAASLSKVQQEINESENYLSNASFTSDMDKWGYANDVRVFNTSGGLLHFNEEFYSDKRRFAGIVSHDGMNVLRLKNSYVEQSNGDFAKQPEFKKVEKTEKDEEGNEVGTGELVYRPTMFYASFKYKVKTRGTLTVCFTGEEKKEDFEEYEPLYYSREVGETEDFLTFEWAGKWNGTGNFYIGFTGEMMLYSAALADNKLADMEEWWSMQLEITEKKIQANAEHIIQQGENLEEYRGEFLFTAEQLRTEFTELVQNKEDDITEAYTGLVTQTARELTSEYDAKLGDYYGEITEEYNSKITQKADEITAKLTADIKDMETGLKEDYTTAIETKAGELTATFNGEIKNLKDGDIATMKSSIEANTKGISTKVEQSSFDALTQRVTKAESSITQQADEITLRVTKGELAGEVETINAVTDAIMDDVADNKSAAQAAQNRADAAYGYASTNYSLIQQQDGRISALAGSIKTDASGNITNISTSGLLLEGQFATLFSTQVDENGLAHTADLDLYVLEDDLEGLVSKIEISADQIDLTGKVTMSSLSSDVTSEIDSKATQSDINSSIGALENRLGSLAYKDSISASSSYITGLGSLAFDSMVEFAKLGSTIVEGSYIKTGLIDASALRINGSQVSGLGSLAYLSSVDASNVSGLGKIATYDNVADAMEDETIIVGGMISTSLINVDDLVVKRLEATSSGYAYSLDSSGFSIKDSSGTSLCTLNVNAADPILYLGKGGESVSMSSGGMVYSNPTSSCSMNGYGISFSNGAGINGLTVVDLGTTTQLKYAPDFRYLTSDESLPDPAFYPGKIIFVHASGKNYTVSGKIYQANGSGEASSVSISGSDIFISDGTCWYEFHCE